MIKYLLKSLRNHIATDMFTIFSQALFLAMVLGFTNGTTSPLEFKLISKTLNTTLLECSYTGTEAGSNFSMDIKHNGRKIHVSKKTHLKFAVGTPSCQEVKSPYICSAHSGDGVSRLTYYNYPFYGEAEIFIHPKGSSTIPLNTNVKIECKVSDMCSKDDLFFDYSPHYFLKPVNTQVNKTMNDKRYSGKHVVEARFERPGTFSLTCNSCKGCPERRTSTTKTITVLKPEINRATPQKERHQNALPGSTAKEPSVQDSQHEKQSAAAKDSASVAIRLDFGFTSLIIAVVVLIMQNGLIS